MQYWMVTCDIDNREGPKEEELDDARAAASAAGWRLELRHDYCPNHTDEEIAERERTAPAPPVRQGFSLPHR